MTDTLQRVALQDDLAPDERAAVLRIAKECSLYVLLNAVFAKAEREGLTVRLDLSRSKRGQAAGRTASGARARK